MATVNTIKVTRSAVTTDDKMIGKKIQCADGEVRKIISVPSGSSYMVEGRSRISAHLVVKEGRAFVEIEPETLEGTVTAVRDMGGYARYTFAKKTTKKETPNGVVAIPKALTKKRAEKLVENPETRKSIEEALIESGSIVVDNEVISERLVERLLEKEENERTIIKALNALGYKVTRPKAK